MLVYKAALDQLAVRLRKIPRRKLRGVWIQHAEFDFRLVHLGGTPYSLRVIPKVEEIPVGFSVMMRR